VQVRFGSVNKVFLRKCRHGDAFGTFCLEGWSEKTISPEKAFGTL